jgi:hypothetical protein
VIARLMLGVVGLAVCVSSAALLYLEGDAAKAPTRLPALADQEAKTERTAGLAGGMPPTPRGTERILHIRFTSGGKVAHVTGIIHGVLPRQTRLVELTPADATPEEEGLRLAFDMGGDKVLGFDFKVPLSPLRWDLSKDGQPWPAEEVHAGPFGLRAPDLVGGVDATCADGFAEGAGLPFISATHDLGLFVSCELP